MEKLCLKVIIATFAAVTSAWAEEAYNPKIDPADFSSKIDNPLIFSPVGRETILETKSPEGFEHNEIRIRGETRLIMGVETLVYNDRVFLDGQLIEEANDYLAQDKAGNVWYFGEAVDNYKNGVFKDHHGSWIAGIGGALPGIWMKAKPQVGDSYRQEYLKGEAEDWAKIISTNETVTVPAGTFKNCTKIFEWTPLDPGSTANKFYCPDAGGITLEIELPHGKHAELIAVKNGN
jgi:hypothetical protein